MAAAVGPTLLPALDIRETVPAPLRTMVVVPTLLTTVWGVGYRLDIGEDADELA